MDSQLQNLLEELYAVDPALRSKEKELRQIIEVLLKSKPDIQLDPSFREQLRVELQKHIPKEPILNQIKETNYMKRFSIVFGSLLLVALVIGGITLQNNQKKQTQLADGISIGEGKITRLADNAFGTLKSTSVAPDKGAAAQTAATPPASTQVSPQSAPSSAMMAPARGLAEPTYPPAPSTIPSSGKGGGGPANSMMRIYQPVTPHYVYNGPAITIPADKLEVLKRTDQSFNNTQLSDFFKKLNFGVIDFGGFNNLNLDAFTVSEKDGYTINVDTRNASVNIYAPYKGYNCNRFSPCTVPRRSISDIPSDQSLIDISNQFIADHHINLKNYGTPKVVSYWKNDYQQTTDKANYYIPEVDTVLYPAQINGIGVYDEGGTEVGLTVEIMNKQISGLSQLDFANYDSSLYPTESDTAKIMSIVEKGGFNSYYGGQPGGKTEDIQLGTPKLQLMTHYEYDANSSTELFVPALVFPVISTPTDPQNYYKKNVVVPIIKSILDSPNQAPIGIMAPAIQSLPAVVPHSK
jgi:hypothetical protein